MRLRLFVIAAACLSAWAAGAQLPSGGPPRPQAFPPTVGPDAPAQPRSAENHPSTYVLGPGDQITIRVRDVEELGAAPVRVDAEGYIRLLYIGRIRAAGVTPEQLRSELTDRLRQVVLEPDVTIAITEFRSQPVSILGAVRTPGVHQLQGKKTLIEVLSLAGGMDSTAGPTVKITRRVEWGRIPLKNAVLEPTGQFSVAEVSVKSILEASSPEENILIRPDDVISVPRANMIYVVGQVAKPGGFALNEQESMSVLQAVSLAGGLAPVASPKNARILRQSVDLQKPVEIPIDIRRILEGKLRDVQLHRDDILFVPSSTPKRAAARALDAAIHIGTGVVIWGR